jgi:hypothetical protein
MMKHADVTESVDALTGQTPAHITRILNDRITRAFLMPEGIEKELALDYNARLVTALHEAQVWPGKKPPHPCGDV